MDSIPFHKKKQGFFISRDQRSQQKMPSVSAKPYMYVSAKYDILYNIWALIFGKPATQHHTAQG
jgi:hypothetical protein